MKLGCYVLLAFAAAVADSALAPHVTIFGARPDLLVLVVVYGGLALGTRPATIAGLLLGLVADSEFPEYLGLHALALTLIGAGTASIWDRLVKANVLVQCAALFVASFAHDVIYYTVYYRNHMDMLGRFLVRQGLLGGLYTAAIGGALYGLARLRGWGGVGGGLRG